MITSVFTRPDGARRSRDINNNDDDNFKKRTAFDVQRGVEKNKKNTEIIMKNKI